MQVNTIELNLLELSSGTVSYRLIGNGKRKILFFHGFPGSSAQLYFFHSFFNSNDVQILCFDRPGYNKTFLKSKSLQVDSLSETVKIADELTTKLSWEKFEVITYSGGTPYGIKFTQAYPNKVSSVQVICGLGYFKNNSIKKYFSSFRRFSLKMLPYLRGSILKKIIDPGNRPPSNKRKPLFELFYPCSASDQHVIAHYNLGGKLDEILREAVIQNTLGPIQDSKAFFSDWGAQFDQIRVPVHFWHGDEDLVIHSDVSKEMANLIPGAKFYLVKGEGHLSLIFNKSAKIIYADSSI